MVCGCLLFVVCCVLFLLVCVTFLFGHFSGEAITQELSQLKMVTILVPGIGLGLVSHCSRSDHEPVAKQAPRPFRMVACVFLWEACLLGAELRVVCCVLCVCCVVCLGCAVLCAWVKAKAHAQKAQGKVNGKRKRETGGSSACLLLFVLFLFWLCLALAPVASVCKWGKSDSRKCPAFCKTKKTTTQPTMVSCFAATQQSARNHAQITQCCFDLF